MPRRHKTDRMNAARAQFARNLTAAIEDAGITQADLARALGASPGTVGNYCQGLSVPALENLIIIARTVRQSVSWLVGDVLHGTDTLEQYERALAIRLGGERLRALAHVPDDSLLSQIDLLIRSWPAPVETDTAQRKPTPIRQRARK